MEPPGTHLCGFSSEDMLDNLKKCTSDATCKNLIDSLVLSCVSTKPWTSHTLDTLMEFFINISSHKNLRKYMFEKLNTLKIQDRTLFQCVISHKIEKLDVEDYSKILNFLNSYIQNLSHAESYSAFLEEVFPVYLHVFKSKNHLFLSLSLQQLAVAISKKKPEKLEGDPLEMVSLMHSFIRQEDFFNFEDLSRCTVILSQFLTLLPEETRKSSKNPTFPILDFLEGDLQLKNCHLENIFKTENLKSILNVAIYTTVEHRDITLLEKIYTNLIDLGITLTSLPPHISAIARTLEALSKHLKNSQNFEVIFQKALVFSIAHLDHFIDNVVLNTKNFLKSFSQEAFYRYKTGETQHVDFLFQVLAPLFGKVRLNALAAVSQTFPARLISVNCHQIQEELLQLATMSSDHDIAGLVYSNLMMDSTDEEITNFWLHPIFVFLKAPNLKFYHVLETIILNYFKKKPEIFESLFSSVLNERECVLMLKCVHYARMHGLVIYQEESKSRWRNLLDSDVLNHLMVHQDEEVRINVLRIIAECQKTTEQFTKWELTFLLEFLKYNVSVEKNSTRNRMITYFQKILQRHNLTKTGHIGFIEDFVKLLGQYLSPDSNYSRRSISLELLCFSSQFLTLDSDICHNLTNILNDSYESNRHLAITLLLNFRNPLKTKGEAELYFDSCVNLACDVRSSLSQSAVYKFHLLVESPLFDSKTTLISALLSKINEKMEENLYNVGDAPYYGLLATIRSLLVTKRGGDDYRGLFAHLIGCCLTVKDHVMPIVCCDSPEGNTFMEGEIVVDESSKAQRLLVYAWKTMKETMLLLAEIVAQGVAIPNLTDEVFLKVGDFFIQVFITSKHRGVFEQAHVAFSSICRSFVNSKRLALIQLPEKWLADAICLCTGATTNDKLCATRRSAGLPFLILSLLPSLPIPSLELSMTPLLNTSLHSPLPSQRMHPLNVLRFIFKDSKLAELSNRYLDNGAIAALSNLGDKEWGVRNSATLLLAAVVGRIFGQSNRGEEKKLTLTVFGVRHRELLKFMLAVLKERDQGVGLFGVLLLLARLYPSSGGGPNTNVKMGNPIFRIRDLASRASISFISQGDMIEKLNENFGKFKKGSLNDNEYHGILLQVSYILTAIPRGGFPISDFLRNSMYILEGKHHSHLVVCLYMDVIYILLSKHEDYNDLTVLKEIVKLLAQVKTQHSMTCQTSFSFSRFQLLCFILLNKFEHVKATYTILSNILRQALFGKDREMKRKSLCFLIYLNEQCTNDRFKQDPLIMAGDVEICNRVKNLINTLDTKTKIEFLISIHETIAKFFKIELVTKNKDFLLLVLLLLRFYPCYFITQQSIDSFMDLSNLKDEEITSAMLSCLRTYLISAQLPRLNYQRLIKLIMESAAPNSADFRRLTTAQLLVSASFLLKSDRLTDYDKFNLANVVVVLLEDDEAIIRDTITLITCKHGLVTSKARVDFFKLIVDFLPQDFVLCFLVSWACRRLPEVSRDTSEVYERGELNTYAENIPVISSASEVLLSLIEREDNKNFVFNLIIKSLEGIRSPMMDPCTKFYLIEIFKTVILNEGKSVKKADFRSFLLNVISNHRNNLKTDYLTVKQFLLSLFLPEL